MTSVIGIDPGSATGIALLTDKGLYPRTFDWGKDGEAVFTHLRGLASLLAGQPLTVVVEVPGDGYRPRKVNTRANYKIATNVGECRLRAQWIATFCRALGLNVIERRPVYRLTKLNAASWKAYFPKYVGRVPSGHARDASLLALTQRGWAW